MVGVFGQSWSSSYQRFVVCGFALPADRSVKRGEDMRFRRFLWLSISLCVSMVLRHPITFAQQPTGSVVGNAYDQSAASVAGAQVTLRNVATGEAKTLTASSEGYFEFLSELAVSELLAEAKGF